MSEWKTYRLSDLINLVGGGTPKTTVAEYWNGDIPWLSVVDFGKGIKKVYQTEKSITEKGLNESSTKILKEGQIIISARGTVGELAVLGRDMAFNQSCYGIYSNEKSENNFLYYLLKYSIGKIKKNTHGAVFDTITKQTFDNIEVSIPDLPTQRQITQILSSLDDKIELNLQMNQTLEAMAQAIFKEWFVNFNFPGFDGELVDGLPKGWRMGVLSDVIEFTNGFAFKSTDLLDYPEEDCYHVFKMGNINKGGGFNYEGTKSYFKKADADKLGKYILRKGDLLMCMTDMKDNVALLGHTALMNQNDKFLVNQRVGLLRPNNKLSIDYPYLYILTNYPEFIKELRSRANRGVQVNLSTSEIKNTKIVIPEQNVNVQFDELAKPVFEKIFANIENIQELTQTRDTLLPKLMSGQLEVRAALVAAQSQTEKGQPQGIAPTIHPTDT